MYINADIVTSVSYVKELQEDVTADLECLLIRTIGTSLPPHVSSMCEYIDTYDTQNITHE